MPRLLLILALGLFTACSSTGRGIPAPIESRDEEDAATARMGRVMPAPAPTARTFPAQTAVPGIDDVTPAAPSAPVTSSSGQNIDVPRAVTPPAPAPQDSRSVPPPLAQPQAVGTPASALLASVDTAIAEGELERAAALAERALRISPRDAYLWYRLAHIRLQQGRNSDAVGFAQRALSFAGSDRELTAAINALLQNANGAAR